MNIHKRFPFSLRIFLPVNKLDHLDFKSSSAIFVSHNSPFLRRWSQHLIKTNISQIGFRQCQLNEHWVYLVKTLGWSDGHWPLVRHRCLCDQSRRHIPDTRLRATLEERSKCFWIWIKEFSKCHRGRSKFWRHNRIRKLTLGLRLYGLGAVSTQRLRRLWTWIRTFDTLVNLDTYIWYTAEPG